MRSGKTSSDYRVANIQRILTKNGAEKVFDAYVAEGGGWVYCGRYIAPGGVHDGDLWREVDRIEQGLGDDEAAT